MTEQDKINVFEKEYLYIKNDDLREDAKYLVSHLPDYFFKVDASSTGKYHPKYAAGDGGLSRHVKSACKFAYELLANPIIGKPYSDRDKDLIIIALLIHDGLKYGSIKEQYTRFDHPILASEYAKNNKAPMDKFVHMCDYLASRRFINLDFDENSNVIDESKM